MDLIAPESSARPFSVGDEIHELGGYLLVLIDEDRVLDLGVDVDLVGGDVLVARFFGERFASAWPSTKITNSP